MKTIRLLIIAVLFSVAYYPAFAQHEKMKQILEDVDEEMDNNNFTLRFFDALTGDPVQGASVLIENIGSFVTDSAGRVIFPKQPDGLLKAVFKKPGYISAIVSIDVAAETILRNRYFVSPVMNIEQFRVVLTWDQQPEDLDAHFLKDGSYHISFRNTRVLNDGSGQLDRDDMDGYGPETITVAQLNAEASYTFFVNNFSAEKNPSSKPISSSRAIVWVYGNNRLLNTFNAPTNIEGNKWVVFKIVQGKVVPL